MIKLAWKFIMSFCISNSCFSRWQVYRINYDRRLNHESTKWKRKTRKKTVDARDRGLNRIFPWNPKESVISAIRKFRGIRVFSWFRDSKTQQEMKPLRFSWTVLPIIKDLPIPKAREQWLRNMNFQFEFAFGPKRFLTNFIRIQRFLSLFFFSKEV